MILELLKILCVIPGFFSSGNEKSILTNGSNLMNYVLDMTKNVCGFAVLVFIFRQS